MRKWLLAIAVFLGLLASGGVTLAQSGCPPEASIIVDGPLCPGDQVVSGRVAGTACGDAAVTVRHTAPCYGIDDRLVGAGRTTANGDFAVPLSETLQGGCMMGAAWINVDVECSCGPLRVERGVYGPPKIIIPPTILVPQAGETTLSGQWDLLCAGTTLTVTDQQGNVVGTGIVQADGSFVIQLLRPLETNEIVTVFFFPAVGGGICGFCAWASAYMIGPVAVPEPSTLLLLAGGLAGLAAVVKARRGGAGGSPGGEPGG